MPAAAASTWADVGYAFNASESKLATPGGRVAVETGGIVTASGA